MKSSSIATAVRNCQNLNLVNLLDLAVELVLKVATENIWYGLPWGHSIIAN